MREVCPRAATENKQTAALISPAALPLDIRRPEVEVVARTAAYRWGSSGGTKYARSQPPRVARWHRASRHPRTRGRHAGARLREQSLQGHLHAASGRRGRRAGERRAREAATATARHADP